jgi:hypothetical protein
MRRITSLSLAIGLAAAALLVWQKSPSFTQQAQAVPQATQSISPEALLRQMDATALPVHQYLADPV